MGAFDDLLLPPAPEREPSTDAPATTRGGFDDLLAAPPAQPAPVPAGPSPTVAKGSLLPLSKDAAGYVSFDPSAGIVGDVSRAFTLPGRVQSGETQMPSTFDPAVNDPRAGPMIGEALNFGSTFGPRNSMVRSGDLPIPGEKRTMTPAPSSADLLKKGGEQLEAYRTSGSTYPVDAVEQFVNDARKGVGQYVKADPLTHEALDVLQAKTKSQPFITAADIDEFRQATSAASKKGERGAMQARSSLYDYLEGTGDKSVMEGVKNYAAGTRGSIVDTILRKAESASNEAGALASGAGRQAESIRTRPRGFSEAELAALEDAKTAGGGWNTAANVVGGKNLAGQIVRGTLAAGAGTASAFMGGPIAAPLIGLAPETTAAGLRGVGGAIRRGAVEDVGTLVRQRSPLFQEQLATQDLTPGKSGRDAITRALMLMGTRTQPPQPQSGQLYDPENYT